MVPLVEMTFPERKINCLNASHFHKGKRTHEQFEKTLSSQGHKGSQLLNNKINRTSSL